MAHDYIMWARSRWFQILIYGLAGLILLLGTFQAGVYVGARSSMFARGFGDNYARMFDGDDNVRGMHGMMPGADLPNGHGAFGTIIGISPDSITVAGVDKVEKVVRYASTTPIRRMRQDASITDLTAGETVIVFGDPVDDGSIDARLIRIVPSPAGPTTPPPASR